MVKATKTSRERLEGCLARIVDPGGEGARTFVGLYQEEARAAADAADARARFGHTLGPLDGVIVSIKDLFDVAGETTKGGSAVYADRPPALTDAPVVARLRAAGAVIVGRTNMSEFAFSGIGYNPHFGTPGNPADRRRIPGGSSSGAAVSVADGMCEVAIGSDTGGSVRLPAAFCGVSGFKPTQHRISRDGAMPLSTTLDSIGPLAKSLDLISAADCVMAGIPQRGTPPAELDRLHVAIPRGRLTDGVDPAIERAFENALAALLKGGVRLTEIDIAPLLAINDAIAELGSIIAVEAADLHADALAQHRDKIDKHVVRRTEAFSKVAGAQFARMLRLRRDSVAAATRTFLPFDAILLPTSVMLAPILSELLADDDLYARTNLLVLRNTTQFNVWDGCGMSIPLPDAGPLHAGLMIMGARGTDDRVFAAGFAIERAFARM